MRNVMNLVLHAYITNINCLSCSNDYYFVDEQPETEKFFSLDEIHQNFPNYYYDSEALKYKKCSPACKKCSDSAIHCIECADNYFFILDNLERKECIHIDIIESDTNYQNYYLDLNDITYKKCDSSCAKCKVNKENCFECSENYYFYEDFENRCFKTNNPLVSSLSNYFLPSDGKTFLKCDPICMQL